MAPWLRKLLLTAHVTFSVGWLGSIVPYLALAIAGLTSEDPTIIRAAYLSMGLIASFVIVPLSLAALLTGLVQSLATPWGLFRHWWILVKLILTTAATVILLNHMPTITRMSRMATDSLLSSSNFRGIRIQIIVHAAGGLLVLLTVTALSVFKPWGLTPYGKRRTSQDDLPARPTTEDSPVLAARRPRWGLIVGVHAIVLLILFVVAHLLGLVPHGHAH